MAIERLLAGNELVHLRLLSSPEASVLCDGACAREHQRRNQTRALQLEHGTRKRTRDSEMGVVGRQF